MSRYVLRRCLFGLSAPPLTLPWFFGCAGARGAAADGEEGAPVIADGPCLTPAGTTTLFPDYAYDVVVNNEFIYLATMQGVLRMPAAGGPSTSLTPNAEADALAIDTANAYYISSHPVGAANAQGKVSSSTALYAVPLVGGTPQVLVDGAFAMHLATDGIWLWWAGVGLEGVGLGQPSDSVKFSLEPGASVEAIAVGRDALFLAVYAVQAQGPGAGSIRRAAKNGSNVTTIVGGLQHPTAIALDEDTVYFNDAGSAAGGIDRAALDGSHVTTIAPVLTNSLAVDGHAVYFATADAIEKVPKAGGNIQTVASGLKAPGTLAVHGGNVYWVDGTSVARSDPNPGYAVMTACK